MAVISENELPESARALWQKARQADTIGNHGYVIQLLHPVLKESPGFLEGRRLVRKAAIAQTKGKKSMLSLSGLGGSGTLKKDPLLAIEQAEKTLATDPSNVSANLLLRDACNKVGLEETAAFALETLVMANPRDTKMLHELGAQYNLMGQADKAVAIYSKIAELNPTDLDAIKKSKDAAASATMKKGKWEEVAASGGAKSFRDILNNKDQTKTLEDQAKIVRTSEQIIGQIHELYGIWEQNESAVDPSKRLAGLYEQLFEVTLTNGGTEEQADEYLNNALHFYNHTNTLTGGGDPAIARKATDLRFKQMDRRIQTLENWLKAADPNHPDVAPHIPAVTTELEELKNQRHSSTIETAKKRVADNPTDLQLRYELGEALMKSGQITDAIPELQRARQNPNVRLKSMNLLGQCFVEKGMLDLAVTQFKTAASEIIAMDTTKKEVLYKLGLVYEQMGKKEDYLGCMKEIYEADYGYKDVSKRVESSYAA